jgi:hypothetical protein
MYIKVGHLSKSGLSMKTIERKVNSGEWEARSLGSNGEGEEMEILILSLPEELQAAFVNTTKPNEYPEQLLSLLSDSTGRDLDEHANEIKERLIHLPPQERKAWLAESLRMSKIMERYAGIRPKRQRDHATGELDFVPGVYELCRETACEDYLINSKRRHRSKVMSPFTLDGLYRAYLREGLVIFLPKRNKKPLPKQDKRCAIISEEAIRWINTNWRRHTGPYPCYDKLREEALKHSWKIPSKSWFYRLWLKGVTPLIKALLLEGRGTYVAKYEPYVPRDYSDLEALQVLCGDHSERDILVNLPNGNLARPWLTLWYDLRTGLIWGWHLDLTPSSQTAGMAYADGVRNFGAQPIARPDRGFYSYVYTDRGRDYKSHRWDGKVLTVHKEAMCLSGGIEWLRVQRRVGILDELQVKHLLSRGRNPKEKPVERIHKDISCWEANNFEEYCGRDAKSKPDRLLELCEDHKQFERGNRKESPFITLDAYRGRLAEFITRYNSKEHIRPTLGSRKVVPIEEYKRLYTTRYEIDEETLALLLLKSEQRVIGKNGVQCFQKHWFYLGESLSEFKGSSVEVRYSDDDYSRVFVFLPNGRMCEARRVNPTSLLNPDKETVKRIRQVKRHERLLAEEFQLLSHSQLRGETVEDRVARETYAAEETSDSGDSSGEDEQPEGRVYQLTRLERARRRPTPVAPVVTSAMVAQSDTDISIFAEVPESRIREFDYDE